MWEIEVRHAGLNRFRLVRDRQPWVAEQKAAALRAQWDEQWAVKQGRDRKQQSVYMGKDEAGRKTVQAVQALNAIQNLLVDGVKIDHSVDWNSLKDRRKFDEPVPKVSSIVAYPPEVPKPNAVYPKVGLLEFLIPPLKRSAILAAAQANATLKANHDEAVAGWHQQKADIDAQNAASKAAFARAKAEWEARLERFGSDQLEQHGRIDQHRRDAERGDESAVTAQIELSLLRAPFPNPFNSDFELEYSAVTKSAVIDFMLPSPDQMPTLKEVRYVQTRHQLVEKHASEAERNRTYDTGLYQAALYILHVAFGSGAGDRLERVTLNGWVDFIDKATGMDERSCILTIGANRLDVAKIDFGRVDPKECFRALKGISASKLTNLAPVAPLERPRLVDKRFVASQDVAGAMEAGVNIAAMDWKDFEHLVRQVFESEFSSAGSEVRVTQASRDGGVDAIVFDPDPIRGGKIVIQAKRYTNTVDVSSVRDLYGTVLNEGASKGILVTTSQFGPDARKFAQGKPLTLIDGSNLLHLLEKMGVQARIDLREAKAFFSSQG